MLIVCDNCVCAMHTMVVDITFMEQVYDHSVLVYIWLCVIVYRCVSLFIVVYIVDIIWASVQTQARGHDNCATSSIPIYQHYSQTTLYYIKSILLTCAHIYYFANIYHVINRPYCFFSCYISVTFHDNTIATIYQWLYYTG